MTFLYQSKQFPILTKWLIIILVLFYQIGCAATVLTPYEAKYTTRLNGIKISGKNKLEIISDQNYRVSWNAKIFWMEVNEWSEFELINDNQIRPLSYHYIKKGFGSSEPIHIYFDWQNHSQTIIKGSKESHYSVAPGTHDKLSYQIQMQVDLSEKPNSKVLNYKINTDGGKLRHYDFNFQGEEIIETKLGDALALIYTKSDSKRETKIWIAPERDYLPVKIEHIEKGHSSILSIKSWSNYGQTQESL